MCIDVWIAAVVSQKSQERGLPAVKMETVRNYQYFCRTTGGVSQPVALELSDKKETNKSGDVHSPMKCEHHVILTYYSQS
jgi:hypothetical protein